MSSIKGCVGMNDLHNLQSRLEPLLTPAAGGPVLPCLRAEASRPLASMCEWCGVARSCGRADVLMQSCTTMVADVGLHFNALLVPLLSAVSRQLQLFWRAALQAPLQMAMEF